MSVEGAEYDADQLATPGTPEWMARFARVTRVEVLRRWNPDSCLASTRVGLEVLRYFGVPARARAVRFSAFTADAFRSGARLGHSLGVAGTGVIDGNHWDGHLVVEQLNGPWPVALVDLSLDQASRPDRGLPLEPSVIEIVDPGWGRPYSRAVLARDDGAVVVYEPMDCPDASWQGIKGWWDRPKWRRTAAGAAIRVLRGD